MRPYRLTRTMSSCGQRENSLLSEPMRKVRGIWTAVGLLAVMAVLMLGAAQQDSATVDETAHLSIGYIAWKGWPTRMGSDEHPPLGQMLMSVPLNFMDVKYSVPAEALLKGELSYPWALSWAGKVISVQNLIPAGCTGRQVQLPPLGDVLVQWNCPGRYPSGSWYYLGPGEGQLFGKYLVYDGTNNGDAMLLAGRAVQIGITLLTGVVIFLWARKAAKVELAGLAALALWTFNPTALSYGHLTNTDISVTFGIALAVYAFAQFLEAPDLKRAAWAGATTGLAMVLKYTALILGPVFVVGLFIACANLKKPVAELGKMAGAFLVTGWAVTLVAFLPWSPFAPPPTPVEMATLEIPGWFQALRPVLVPCQFFKGIAMALGHSKIGTGSYLCGVWKNGGWWYYFPVALVLKSSVSFVALVLAGAWLFLRQFRKVSLLEQMGWVGAGGYLAASMSSGINLGVRHLLPMFPLLCVGVGCGIARLADRRARMFAWGLVGWQAAIALMAFPLYLQFFSEAVGGSPNGYRYLVDSNFDWGQDANRLKKFLDERKINHIYLDYFGTQFSIEHLKIPNTRVTAETAKQIQQGTLVVSVSQLVRPEWAWLRNMRQPIARVANTLFVYQFP